MDQTHVTRASANKLLRNSNGKTNKNIIETGQ